MPQRNPVAASHSQERCSRCAVIAMMKSPSSLRSSCRTVRPLKNHARCVTTRMRRMRIIFWRLILKTSARNVTIRRMEWSLSVTTRTQNMPAQSVTTRTAMQTTAISESQVWNCVLNAISTSTAVRTRWGKSMLIPSRAARSVAQAVMTYTAGRHLR